ncbi:YfhO family protein [Candidatus Woesebacteria bacterium]|nr:YfhO family protein [Candidatus Woesebacteria bacterium]
MERKFIVSLVCIIIVSLISISDLFLHQGRSITFDGHIHMTTMAQFATALKDGEFPVRWSNNFANYGLPLPLFAHQLPAYSGALFILLGSSVVTAYNLTLALAICLSGIFFYIYLRKKTSEQSALIATLLFTLFPYRIINIYIRGALPEILSTVFFPLILLGIDQAFRKQKRSGSLLVFCATALLALTHPMMLLIFGMPTALYCLFSIKKRGDIRTVLALVVSAGLGVGVASYYLIPLVLEMKYFYEGTQTAASSFVSSAFMGVRNFFDPQWYYYLTHPGPRGNLIKFGIPELFMLLVGVVTTVFVIKNKKGTTRPELLRWSIISLIALFFLLPLSSVLYTHVPGLSEVQYPWRFLSVLQFSIPIVAALCIDHYHLQHSKLLLLGVVCFIVLRMPQLYGKNFADFPESQYYFTRSNLHSQNLNTIWSDNSEKYPVKTQQAEIISGDGVITDSTVKNASRSYEVTARSEVRLVDYTFYFPGWKVISDGTELPIEFQDMNYRGLITYVLPAGKHTVSVEYGFTKVRLVAVFLTLASFIAAAVWISYLSLPINRRKTTLT